MKRAAPLLILLFALALVGDVARRPDYTATWSSANGINVAGYIVERSDSEAGPWERVSGLIVAGEDVFESYDYRVVDVEGAGRWHRLAVVTLNNEINLLGTISP